MMHIDRAGFVFGYAICIMMNAHSLSVREPDNNEIGIYETDLLDSLRISHPDKLIMKDLAFDNIVIYSVVTNQNEAISVQIYTQHDIETNTILYPLYKHAWLSRDDFMRNTNIQVNESQLRLLLA